MIRKIFLPLLFIVAWQYLIPALKLPDYILPTPVAILHSLIKHRQLIALQSVVTLIEILLGLGIGIVFGIITAISMCWFRALHSFLLPLLLFSQILPIFAVAPLFVLWFGYGITAKILITSLALFFPIANNFLDGLQQTPRHYLELAQLMNSNHWQMLYQIRIPAALPHLASGIRLATAMAPLGALVGEWVGSSQGLGFLLLSANAQMQVDLMFAILSVIFLFGISLYLLMDKLLQLSMPWLAIKE